MSFDGGMSLCDKIQQGTKESLGRITSVRVDSQPGSSKQSVEVS